jgi:anti-sigma regulatory factor (Ser/Thr protein kinase)
MTKIDSITFDELLRTCNPFDAGASQFDLSGADFISPAGLVQVTAACHSLAKAGRPPTVKTGNGDVRGYLSRSGFFSALDGVAQIDPPLPRVLQLMSDYQRGRNPLLIEVTKINSGALLPELLTQIVQVLRRRMKYKKNDAFDVAIAISELCQNTFDHNSGTCGFLAMQAYGKGTNRFIEVAVADFGDGLLKTLGRNAKHRGLGSDVDAIRLAIQPGVSEHDDATRGTGLHHLVEITYRHSGSVQIRSGAGKVRFRMDKKIGHTFSVPRMPGVQVALTLKAKEPEVA